MAYVIVNEFDGGTREQYDATVAVVHPPDGLPAGQTHHYAGPSAAGWTVVAIWDSKETWDRFRDETLVPGLQSVAGGLPAPPRSVEFEAEVEL